MQLYTHTHTYTTVSMYWFVCIFVRRFLLGQSNCFLVIHNYYHMIRYFIVSRCKNLIVLIRFPSYHDFLQSQHLLTFELINEPGMSHMTMPIANLYGSVNILSVPNHTIIYIYKTKSKIIEVFKSYIT